jgi:DNA-3-methyladenine glycosylase II
MHARGPYDFERSFRRIVCAVVATRHPEMGERARPLDDGEFALALRLRGKPLLFGLRQDASGAVAPRLLAGRLERNDEAAAWAEIRRILCLDHDLDAFYEAVVGDRPIERLTRLFRGLRLVLSPTPFQGLVHAILFQQISYAAAQTVENRLVERWGASIGYGDRRFPLFPTPETLAALHVDTLRSAGIPPRKAQAILEVARETCSGRLDLDDLARSQDPEAVAKRLQSIHGVGPWTAHHVIIRGMGMIDCLPREDPGLRRAVSEQYAWDAVTVPQIEQLAERWRPWRSYATYYLWNTFWE